MTASDCYVLSQFMIMSPATFVVTCAHVQLSLHRHSLYELPGCNCQQSLSACHGFATSYELLCSFTTPALPAAFQSGRRIQFIGMPLMVPTLRKV